MQCKPLIPTVTCAWARLSEYVLEQPVYPFIEEDSNKEWDLWTHIVIILVNLTSLKDLFWKGGGEEISHRVQFPFENYKSNKSHKNCYGQQTDVGQHLSCQITYIEDKEN